jgi:hypothetical protein
MIMITFHPSIGRRLVAASILAVGFGTVWAVLVLWIGSSVLESWRGNGHLRQETLVVDTDGTPLIRSVPLDDLSKVSFRDLDGREHGVLDREGLTTVSYLYGERDPIGGPTSQLEWWNRIKVFHDEREPAAVWYFVHDGRADGSGAFVGYERVSNRLIGSIGLAGFRAHPVPAAERIPVRGELAAGNAYWSSEQGSIHGARFSSRVGPWDVLPRRVHVPSGNLLRVVDLAARTTTTVLETPAPISSVGVPTLWSWSSGEEPAKGRPILVRAGDEVYKLDHEYHVAGVVALPAEIGPRVALSWYESDDGRAVVECPPPGSDEEGAREDVRKTMVYRFAADGTVESSRELALQTGSARVNERVAFGFMALSLPAPAPLLGFQSFLMAMRYGSSSYPRTLGILLRRAWPSLAATLAVAAVLAVAAWRRGAAFGLAGRERNAWAAFVLLLGAPGFAGYLLHRRWPPREPCPHCHANVPRDREACIACGTPFPAPALKGTEIFA